MNRHTESPSAPSGGRPKVAYAGVEGAFAHEACLAFASEFQPVPLPDFDAVVAAVRAGTVEQGMLPLRNSRAGDVPGVAGLIAEADLLIESERALPVRMHLLGLEGAELAGLRLVRSHPMALRQCAGSIERLGLATESASNTALAARELRDPSVAVLASEAAAAAYGLKLLKRDVQDDPDNQTVFGIVKRRAA